MSERNCLHCGSPLPAKASGELRIRFTMTGQFHPALFYTRELANAYKDDCDRQGIACEIVEVAA